MGTTASLQTQVTMTATRLTLLSLFLLTCCQAVTPFEPDPWPEEEEQQDVRSTLPYFRLTAEKGNDATFSFDEKSLEYTVTTSGSDPYLYTEPLAKDLPADSCFVSFEYKAKSEISDLQLFLPYPVSEERSVHLGTLPATDEWVKVEKDLRAERQAMSWGKAGDALRLDFGTSANTIVLRHLYLRAQTEAERKAEIAAAEAAELKAAMARRLENYLQASFDGEIREVSVGTETVTIRFFSPDPDCRLAEIRPWESVPEMSAFPYRYGEGTAGEQVLTLERQIKRDNFPYDRLLSRWILVRPAEKGWTPVSHARYPDDVEALFTPSQLPLKNKKGLGGMRANETFYDDLDALQAGSVTLNVSIESLIGTVPFTNDLPYEYNGITYHINQRQVAVYDARLAECAKRGVAAAGIILIGRSPSDPAMKPILLHPEADPSARYTMPNFTSREGVNAYAAALDFMARRYDGENGGMLIRDWILHNEVDFAGTWSNMGEQPLTLFMDCYVRSMRLCSVIARQYNPDATVLISLTHCWTRADGDYAPRDMLDNLLHQASAEGDFLWGIAAHPYPQALGRPAFWNDDNRSTWSSDTEYITFKNLEVWDKWIKEPGHLYRGTQKRLLYLSENGTCSPSYSETDLALQAAGAAWAWKKISALDGIDAVQWHNWMDDGSGDGVMLGLRFPSTYEPSPGGPKPAWEVWKAAGTPQEDSMFAPYLEFIGISSWEDIMHEVQ